MFYTSYRTTPAKIAIVNCQRKNHISQKFYMQSTGLFGAIYKNSLYERKVVRKNIAYWT